MRSNSCWPSGSLASEGSGVRLAQLAVHAQGLELGLDDLGGPGDLGAGPRWSGSSLEGLAAGIPELAVGALRVSRPP